MTLGTSYEMNFCRKVIGILSVIGVCQVTTTVIVIVWWVQS